jgi:hypothetical protein
VLIGNAYAQNKPEITRHKFKFAPKAGFLVNHPLNLKDKLDEQMEGEYDTRIGAGLDFGFTAGGMMTYKVTDRFLFQTELLFSQKGKILNGGVRDIFEFTGKYQFIEVPLLCRVNYDMNGWGWYLVGGGRLSYWLNGSGSFYNFEIYDAGVRENIPYTIDFRPPEYSPNTLIHVQKANRIQLGIDIGIGWYFDIRKGQSINLDLRYTLGQSWMAMDEPIDFGLFEYSDDLRHSIGSLAITMAYVFDFDPMDAKKGKSGGRR